MWKYSPMEVIVAELMCAVAWGGKIHYIEMNAARGWTVRNK